MDFGEALRELKAGRKLARAGWNGKGMYVFMRHGQYPARSAEPVDGGYVIRESLVEGVSRTLFGVCWCVSVPVMPSLSLKTAGGSIVDGWLASQTDMLAEDWQEVHV